MVSFTHLKEEMGGGEALMVLEGKHPLVCTRSRCRVFRRRSFCPAWRTGGGRAPAALLSFLPCSQSPAASAARPGRPAVAPSPAEPSLVRGRCGVPASWRIGSRAKREGSGGRAESGLLISGGTPEPVPCFWGLLRETGAGGKR